MPNQARPAADIVKRLPSPEMAYQPEGEISALHQVLEQPY